MMMQQAQARIEEGDGRLLQVSSILAALALGTYFA